MKVDKAMARYLDIYQKLYQRAPRELRDLGKDWVLVNGARMSVDQLESLTGEPQRIRAIPQSTPWRGAAPAQLVPARVISLRLVTHRLCSGRRGPRTAIFDLGIASIEQRADDGVTSGQSGASFRVGAGG